MELFRTIKQRWNTETPKFFKGVKKSAVTICTSATAIWVTNESMSLGLHDDILQVCKYIIASSAAMGLTAQLTRVDSQPDEPQQ